MLLHHIDQCARARVVLRAATLAFLLAVPCAAFAQNGAATDPQSTAPTAQTQPVTDTGATSSLLDEPSFVGKSFELVDDVFGDGMGKPKNGFYPEFSNMITGSGFISAGPGYRRNFDGGKTFFDTSAAVSWHLYKMAQARFEFSQLADDHLSIGAQGMWQDNTQVSYYGIGANAVQDDQTQYRLQTFDVVGYGEVRPSQWLSIGGEFGWLRRPRVMATAGTFNPDYPDARMMFPNDPGMNAAYQPNFLRSELSVMANTLDSRSHPTQGGLYRAALTTFYDQSAGIYGFNQYEAEIVQMVPMHDRRVVLGLHGWTVFSDVSNGHAVPFYLMPYVGGNNTLRAYDDYQFHDQNALMASVELRVALTTHIDAAGFYDVGNVAAQYTKLNFDKAAVGGGLRVHYKRMTVGRADVAYGSEGWKVIFRTTDPFKWSRVTRELTAVPFMP